MLSSFSQVKELKRFGGVDIKNCVFALLPKLLTDKLAAEFSWVGGKRKKKLRDLKLPTIISGV